MGTGGADNTCIRFNVQLNSGSDLLNFSASQITSASFYSINCGPLIPIGTPACITGLSSVCISFCKPGNNSVTYTVTASSIIKGSEDLILRQNCSGMVPEKFNGLFGMDIIVCVRVEGVVGIII
ncbi:MAG: hypothetical protein GXC72_11115 [Chitinophagaceae bacterium]|nr:hypothetical protein [Chitinophagaceae bacterium]